jgi:hypothetical protein
MFNRDEDNDYREWRRSGEHRGWFERAREGIRNWFSADDAALSGVSQGPLGSHEPGLPYEPSGIRHNIVRNEERYGGMSGQSYMRNVESNRPYGQRFDADTYGEHGPVERWTPRDTEYGGTGSQQSLRGRGPRNYQRNDERIREDVIERLTHSHYVDASDIQIEVAQGVVILTGMVDDRRQKRIAADLVEDIFGVKNVRNQLRVRQFTGFGESVNERQPSPSTRAYNRDAEKR